MKKEDIGVVVKKAVRLIPGIGSYQDRESLREADKVLRVKISERLDELIGVVEWIKTDQVKKGAWKKIKDLEDLETDMEKASKTVERAARGFGSVFDGPRVDEDILQSVYEYDKGLLDLLEPIEAALKRLTEKGSVPDQASLKLIRKSIRELITRIGKREDVLKGISV